MCTETRLRLAWAAGISHLFAPTQAICRVVNSDPTRGSTVTVERTMPRIGVISGATIIAPITVAVESVTTPAVAITAASSSNAQNRLSLRARSGPSTGAHRAFKRDRWQRWRASGSVRQAPVSIRRRARTPFRSAARSPAPGWIPIDRPGGCNPRTRFDTEAWPTLTPITRQPGHDSCQIVGVRHLLRFELVALMIGPAPRAPLTARATSCLSSASSRSTRRSPLSARWSISRLAR